MTQRYVTATDVVAEIDPSPPANEPLPIEIEPTIDDVRVAATRIAPYVHRTPLLASSALGQVSGVELWLKAENLQRTGSFKVRGALNAMLQLSPEQRGRGVVTMSAGNHGQGVAYAAQLLGVRCVVFVPATANPVKVDAIRGYGAEMYFASSMETLFQAMEDFRLRHNLHFVHPFGDPCVIAGQGTVGLEIVADGPPLDAIVVCVGGGGLLAGVALTAKSLRPEIRVIGVEPVGAAAVRLALEAGHPVSLTEIATVADGLAAPFTAPLSLELIRRHVDDVVLVTDDEIVEAFRLTLERTKLLVEPAGAAAVAALMAGKAGLAHGSRVAATLSGGNVDRETLKRLL